MRHHPHSLFRLAPLAGVVERVRLTGYLAGSLNWSVAENVSWGSGSHTAPRAVVQAWMMSSGHWANLLLRGFRHVGVGVARDAPVKGYPGAAVYTTDFGRR